MNMNQRIAVKARKPGISRTDCSSPISQPVKPAASLAKLLRRACQLAKLSQLMKESVIRNATGEPAKRSRERRRGSRFIRNPGGLRHALVDEQQEARMQ